MKRLIITALACVLGCCASSIAQPPPAGGAVQPASVPLELNIVPPTMPYKLDLGGKTEAQFKKSLQVLGKTPLPREPEVKLKMELRNTSKQDIVVWAAGDAVVLSLDLKGPSVSNLLAQRMFTLEYRAPKAIKIPAGGTYTIPLDSLIYGFRGVERRSYWTAPGEYILTASLKTGVNPQPAGSKDGGDGFGIVTVTSAPIKLVVEGR